MVKPPIDGHSQKKKERNVDEKSTPPLSPEHDTAGWLLMMCAPNGKGLHIKRTPSPGHAIP